MYGDSAYGSGELVDKLEKADAQVNCKVQPPVSPGGRFSKDAFSIDLNARHRELPSGEHQALRPFGEGRIAKFAAACAGCPLAENRCTSAKEGRTIYVGPYEEQLRAPASANQTPPGRPTTKPPGRRSSERSRT